MGTECVALGQQLVVGGRVQVTGQWCRPDPLQDTEQLS